MTALVDQDDLEAEFPSSHVRGIFCDDGSGTPGPRLARACEVASSLAESLLLLGFTSEQIATLVDEDPAVKSAICGLAMSEGAKAKPEWSGESAPYGRLRSESMTTLKAIAQGHQRSKGEAVAGVNPHLRGDVQSPQDPQYLFAPSRGVPAPGGY
jgi:hypothetical protein